jgi:hypothetical protein
MRKIIFALIVFTSCQSETKNAIDAGFKGETYKAVTLYNINALANKTPAQMEKYFGKPSKKIKSPKDCADLGHCELEAHYKHDSITVLYRDNKAAWFEFDNLTNYPYRNLPDYLGLYNTEPDDKTDRYVHYKSYSGFKNVAFIRSESDPSALDYIVVTLQ